MLYPAINYNHAQKQDSIKIYIDITGGDATLLSAITEIIEDSEFDYKNASQSSVRGAR
jgi:hypothetical protein